MLIVVNLETTENYHPISTVEKKFVDILDCFISLVEIINKL